MLYSETEVRANIRNRDGKRVFYLGRGDQLTSGARDYLNRERIPILTGEQAAGGKYRLITGGALEEKPEHMTHLNGDVLVSKCHPRIALRGAMDMLEAELLLCQQALTEPWRKNVGQILEFARLLMRWEVLDEPVMQQTLCGLTEQELREHSHRPQEYYGQAHFMPCVGDGPEVLALNRARCVARQAELAAVRAFTDREGNPTRTDLIRAMNRLSSMLYILMIRVKAAKGKSI